jgi:hypothetical protein
LNNLTQIKLCSNKIKKIPEEILKLTSLYELENNPIEDPPLQIIKQGNEAVKAYFKDNKRESLNEVKVLLLGYGASGKTSLLKRLSENVFDPEEPQTNGINIKTLNIKIENKEIITHFWDFGGQEIMHSTHQFFLSKRSFYILVLDGRREENEEYWLKLIESFGGKSPILIALNKADKNPSFDVNRKFLLDKYTGIYDFIRISCATGYGIEEFFEKLKKYILKIEIIETKWPQKWFIVKQSLENMKQPYISYEKYQSICKKEGIEGKDQEILVRFLHDLGIVIHFRDPSLYDTNVLRPKWVTNAVYSIISSKQIAEDKGKLVINTLCEILTENECPKSKHQYIVNLMKKFDLCYRINENTVLIPDLLDKQEVDFQFDYDNSLPFIIRYDYLPRSVLPTFFVKMHDSIKNRLNWRTGVVLENKKFESTAVIKTDLNDKKIYIYLTGKQTREYLSMIRGTFHSINKTFEKLTVCELIPLPGYDNYTIEYDELIGYEKNNIYRYFNGKLGKYFDVKFLLNRIETSNERIIDKDKEQPEHYGKQTNTTIEHVSIFGNELLNIGGITKGGNSMKIDKIENKGGQNIFADKIDNTSFVYSENESKLLELIERYSENIEEKDMLKSCLDTLKRPEIERELKLSSKEKIESFLYKHSIPIGQSLTATLLFEIGKYIFL